MRRALYGFLLIFIAATAVAHPSVSVVIDHQHNIYYSDLTQVIRVAPDGKKSIAVRNVHTHELYLDAHDNLFGENLRYEGDATKRWLHSFWKRTSDGHIETIVAEHETFKNEDAISLVRDAAGNSYWADREHNAIMKNRAVLARGTFRDIRWMTVTPEGIVYFIDGVDLMRVSASGELKTVVRGLSTSNSRHAVMGLWTRGNDVYAAEFAVGRVKRVEPRGRVTIVAESRFPWSVTGGAFDDAGHLWVLEWTITNQARVRRVK